MTAPFRPISALLTIVVCSALISGCSPQPADISESAAFELQRAVDDVITSVNENQMATALASLDEVQRRLIQSTAAGEIGHERATTIQTAIDRVKDDLVSALPPSSGSRSR